MKHISRKRVIVAVVFLIVLGFFIRGRNSGNGEEFQTQTATVVRGTIVSSVSVSGQIITSNIFNITSSATGVVSEVFVSDADEVNVGDKIAAVTLDIVGLQNQAAAYSSYLVAKNTLASSEATYHSLQSDMFEVNQKFINDAVARELATNDPTYVQQESDWRAAELKFNNQANVIAQSKVAVTDKWLKYVETKSLISTQNKGKVISLSIAEGMQINESMTVASISSEGFPMATFAVSEVDIVEILPGMKATITLDSIPDKTFTGKVVSVNRVGATTSGVTNYPVTVRFDTSSNQILPNMAATANIIISTKSDILIVPSSAIQTQGNQIQVTVLRLGEELVIPVEVGITSDTQTEILSGLDEGAEVVVGRTSQNLPEGGSPFSRGGFGSGGGLRPGGFGGGRR